MANLRLLLSRIRGLWKDERGITGLETSIMLIAFVVVASVFAFAVLRMGVFSADRLEKTVGESVDEITSVLALRGSVVAHGREPIDEYTESVSFEVRHLIEDVELSDAAIVVNIERDGNCIPLQFGDSGLNPGLSWTVTWETDPGPVLKQVNEPAVITLTLYGLKERLRPDEDFAVAIKPREAPSEPCIPRRGNDSLVLLAGTVEPVVNGKRELSNTERAEFGLDYYDSQSGGGITEVPGSQDDPYVTHLTFLVHNSAPSGSIDLSGESTVVSYSDSTETFSDLPFLEDITNSQIGVGWGIVGDSGPELGPGERAEIQVNIFGLKGLLGPRKEFTVEIRPIVGTPLIIEDKQVPSELNLGTNRLD